MSRGGPPSPSSRSPDLPPGSRRHSRAGSEPCLTRSAEAVMSGFVDQQLVRPSDPAALTAVVNPPIDVETERVWALLGVIYRMDVAAICGVCDVHVQRAGFQ